MAIVSHLDPDAILAIIRDGLDGGPPSIWLIAHRDFEAPWPFHSIGGGWGAICHDRDAHAAALRHDCINIRSGQCYRATLTAETVAILRDDVLNYCLCVNDGPLLGASSPIRTSHGPVRLRARPRRPTRCVVCQVLIDAGADCYSNGARTKFAHGDCWPAGTGLTAYPRRARS